MSQVTTAPHRTEKLWANRNFLILWLGQTVSQFGDTFFRFALTIWIMRTIGIPALAGIMMAASIPGIILGPVAGTLVDKLNRKNIIIYSDIFRGGIALLAAWVMYRQAFSMGYTYALLITFGIVGPLFDSAISATVPNIVLPEHLAKANSLKQAASSGTGLIGPALAAILLTSLGGVETAVPIFFALNGLSYILSGISEIFLIIPQRQGTRNKSRQGAIANFGKELIEGMKHIWDSNMLVRIFLVLAAVNFFMAPLMQVIVPAVIIDLMNLDEIWLGFIQSGIAGGFMLASLVLAAWKKVRLSKVFLASVFALGMGIVLLGIAAGVPLYMVVSEKTIAASMIPIAVIIGATAALTNISLSTIMQKIVPDEKRGRVFACMNTVVRGLIPASLGATGLVALFAPLFIQPVVGGFAVICASIALSRIRELHSH